MTATPTAKTTARKPATKATTRTKRAVAPATPVEKAAATRAASAATDATQVCATCKESLPVRRFPTTAPRVDGTIGRGVTCRACVRARRTTT
jgi:hypothetical protein